MELLAEPPSLQLAPPSSVPEVFPLRKSGSSGRCSGLQERKVFVFGAGVCGRIPLPFGGSLLVVPRSVVLVPVLGLP